ncbi:MAG TPA: CpsD/CapB family tyrosine-protein kinase, partial [Pyrinomonadaceae bacterium]|nr:CpsD/CapB family tyrosine-protein kinase [Pyrinomonadaceae bacterium]
ARGATLVPGNGRHNNVAGAVVTPDAILQSSSILRAPEAAHISASTEHTEHVVGSALPGGQASRIAGATLGAAGSTRTPEFVSIDISAARVEPHLVTITQPQSPYTERYRSLRTRVLHAGESRKMQAFVVTSAGVMEGKTLTALNLSWMLAQSDGTKALLIDGDLRQPCAADYLGIDAPIGLAEVLTGEASLHEAIIKLEPSGLYLLPGGARREGVAELLSGPRWSTVLAEVRRMFDYIMIDAPPLGLFTDATLLISRADAALIVTRSGQTRYAALERALEPIPREKVLGVILNASNEPMDEQGYYYSRRYGRHAETPAEDQSASASDDAEDAARQETEAGRS